MSTNTTRAPVRALRQSASDVASAASAEKARKRASKAALRAAIAAQNAATFGASAPSAEPPAPKADHTAEDHANALETARVDAEALGVPLESVLADMGIDATGAPAVPEKTISAGTLSMMPLRSAALHYKRGVHCNDDVAACFDGCTADQTIAIVGKILVDHNVLEVRNPYLHLNPGQQSMNLRNKLRGAIKNGFVKIGEVQDAVTEYMLPKAA